MRVRRGKPCATCGAWPLRGAHRCASTFEVHIQGVTYRARRVIAASAEEAAVRVADELEAEQRFAIDTGCEKEVAVRRVGSRTWQGVLLTAVEVTSYYPTRVRELGSRRR